MDSATVSSIIQKASNRALSVVGETGARLVYLGDGDGNIFVTNSLNPREVYYRTSLNENERGIATLHPSSGLTFDTIEFFQNIECIAAYPPGTRELHIMRIADTGLRATDGATPIDQALRSASKPTIDAIGTFRIDVDDPNSMFVKVISDPPMTYVAGSALRYFFSDRFDLTSVQAALTSGQHNLSVVCLNPISAALVAVTSTAVSADDTLPSRFELDQSTIEGLTLSGYYPCGIVYLYFGQTAITDDDILRRIDPRILWSPVTSGTQTLTTKGDLWGYSTADARVPVGTNGQVLTADSTQALGVRWAAGGGGGSAGDDALYIAWSAF